jgi:transposase
MGKRSKRVYTLEFKKQAAKLAIEIGSTRAAKQLGVPVSVVAKWKRDELEKGPVKGKEKIDFETEYKRLLAENTEQKKVISILKSAAAFFSRDHLK